MNSSWCFFFRFCNYYHSNEHNEQCSLNILIYNLRTYLLAHYQWIIHFHGNSCWIILRTTAKCRKTEIHSHRKISSNQFRVKLSIYSTQELQYVCFQVRISVTSTAQHSALLLCGKTRNLLPCNYFRQISLE